MIYQCTEVPGLLAAAARNAMERAMDIMLPILTASEAFRLLLAAIGGRDPISFTGICRSMAASWAKLAPFPA